LGIEKGIEIGREKKLAITGNLLSVLDDKAIANIIGLALVRVQKPSG
jgi:hypothetical protein